MATEVWAIGLVVFATIIGAFGSLLFKIGADKLEFRIKKILTNYVLICGVLLYGLSAIFFLLLSNR